MAPAASTPELALYVGPMGNVLGDLGGGSVELVPHETVVEVSRDEAEASDWWKPVGAAPAKPRKARKPRAAKAAKPAATPAAPADPPADPAGPAAPDGGVS